MDVLSEVLKAVRLTGAVYFDVHANAPWVAETPGVETICAKVMPEFEHVVAFHIMLEGWCWAQLGDESEPAIRMNEGDVILFPQGDSHLMGTEPGRRSEPNHKLYYRPTDHPLPFVLDNTEGGGEKAWFACGYLGCDARPFNPIVNALPRMIHIDNSGPGSNPAGELIRMALEESASQRDGSETILAKLSELVFVQALRRHLDSLPPESGGWLSGLRDAHIGKALGLIHGRPAEDWTLDRLAHDVGLSRTVFTERFMHYVQEPPIRYLSRLRMQLALRALESPEKTIAQAAAQVGYQSEAAFNRAFKKYMGVPPGRWRRNRTKRPQTDLG